MSEPHLPAPRSSPPPCRADRERFYRTNAPLNKASQARTCLGPGVQRKLPRLLAPLPELPGSPGVSSRFLWVPSALPGKQLSEHMACVQGPPCVLRWREATSVPVFRLSGSLGPPWLFPDPVTSPRTQFPEPSKACAQGLTTPTPHQHTFTLFLFGDRSSCGQSP